MVKRKKKQGKLRGDKATIMVAMAAMISPSSVAQEVASRLDVYYKYYIIYKPDTCKNATSKGRD